MSTTAPSAVPASTPSPAPTPHSDLDTAADKLSRAMGITERCRRNAAKRLKRYSVVNFIVGIIVGLGLLFIPLMKLSGLKFTFNDQFLDGIQIFFAVLSLIYATVVATARFDVRALQFDACADAVMKLKTEFLLSMSVPLTPAKYKEFAERYADILADKENHSANDYRYVQADRPRDFGESRPKDLTSGVQQVKKSAVPWIKFQAWLISSLLYLTPLAFVFVVFCLIYKAVDWPASKATLSDQAKLSACTPPCPALPAPKP